MFKEIWYSYSKSRENGKIDFIKVIYIILVAKNIDIVLNNFLFIFISEHKLGVPLTVVRSFHSHLEPLRLIAESSMSDQISFGYAAPSSLQQSNHIALPSSSQLSELEDPTRFMSLHCYLFPGSLKMCPKHWIWKFSNHGWTPDQTNKQSKA